MSSVESKSPKWKYSCIHKKKTNILAKSVEEVVFVNMVEKKENAKSAEEVEFVNMVE